ncbi:MAG: single-stranded DNA-binding protein [Thiohalomonadales bacterium]
MSNEIVEPEKTEIEPTQNTQLLSQPDRFLEMAIAKGAGMEQIDKFLDLKERFDKEEARKAFHAAFAEFKKNPPKIIKDMVNHQFNSGYTSIGNMVMTASESLGRYGLTTRWDFPVSEKNEIICTCIISHSMGHEENVTLTGVPDNSGKKNPIQERKSARTYLKLETFEAVTGLVSIAGNVDDDGNSSSKPVEFITESQAMDMNTMIADGGIDVDIFNKFLKSKNIEGVESIPASLHERIIKKIKTSIEAKKNDNP